MIATFALSPAGAADARVHDTQAGRIAVTPVATGLAYPWGFEVLSDGALLVNEIEGRMLLVSADGETRTEVAGVPDVAASGQGGLLDLALSPDFDTSGILYFTFSEPGEGGASTAAARAGSEAPSAALPNCATRRRSALRHESRRPAPRCARRGAASRAPRPRRRATAPSVAPRPRPSAARLLYVVVPGSADTAPPRSSRT